MTLATTAAKSPSGGWMPFFLMLLVEAALIVCWSAGFVGTRFAVAHAPIFLVLLWRNLISGLLLLPFALTMGGRLSARDIGAHAFFGALGMGFYLASFAQALAMGVPTGLVALISDMLPLAVALLSWPILGQALNARQWLGSAIGLGGVLIASGASLSLGNVPVWSYGLPVLGTLCFALVTLFHARSATRGIPIHQSLCIQCLSAAAIFAVLAWHEGGVLPPADAEFAAGILWLVLVATFGAWSLYYIALRKSSPARVTAVLYLSPPVTLIWAWIMFREPLSWSMVAGLLVSLFGIVIFTRGEKPRR
ncbi:DMT family transporter [Gellertiella hungarica]|uniref:Drug/metabolite transporter (DMT)-like permease n=1 Tax=Gellertiella hungarica TaxID=1572859 RepID=A0A7W6J6N6_9HYPH|nr:DMT family transporter [Gellertiella hungarica]MBB4065773.1 drug/metabolite transporter (DMT)-like permease [Gellertiella hungarica]